MATLPEPPNNSPITSEARFCLSVWLKWFSLVRRLMNTSSVALGNVGLASQSASIAATSFATVALVAGLYRITFYARPTQAATTSSTLAPFVTAVESGLTVTQTAPYALTANSVTVPGSWTFFQRIDGNTVIKYGMTYGSVGGTPMVYRMDVWLEAVPSAT